MGVKLVMWKKLWPKGGEPKICLSLPPPVNETWENMSKYVENMKKYIGYMKKI